MKHQVLIVDDYPDSAETASLLLSMLGHHCRHASTAREGLRLADELAPDVAILDIGLPDMSGYELARALRRRLEGRQLYLAAVTGWGQPEDHVKAMAAGFDHHVLKPADRSKLEQIIELAERAFAVSLDPVGRAGG